ncbi:MAG: polyhydroxyalkanoate synthesis repressor PhaR [Alphaproteobacteria bacterium CG_4_10_14_0_8_um_filter_53_9]|nr:MAG: polyhydroxyalkanoate synthesis repressor PhaR [Alphaproteobacteria bacterium CG_4_10_14_0_8_um_filter_53_9]
MSEPLIIKKYANRRLYNTETSQYITLADLADMIRDGRDVEVVDAKTGKDLTRATFAQIIFEEEGKGAAMLPVNFLKTLIGFYDNSMQSILPHYLDMVMDVFSQNQARIREETNKALGGFSPFAHMEKMQAMQRTQLAQMQQVMGLFNPFLAANRTGGDDKATAARIAALEAEIVRLKAGGK